MTREEMALTRGASRELVADAIDPLLDSGDRGFLKELRWWTFSIVAAAAGIPDERIGTLYDVAARHARMTIAAERRQSTAPR